MAVNCKVEAPYPDPEPGFKRVIFALDAKGSREAEVAEHRIQLIPGRTVSMTKNESINIRGYDGHIQEQTVDGWGYDYYRIDLSTNAISTRMAANVEGGDEVISRFVPIVRKKLIKYNSAAPVVVYLPVDAELRYSVWTAGDEHVATLE